MPQANLTPAFRPYDPSTVPSPTPQQAERLERAGNAAVSGYASDGVQNTRPVLAAAALAAGIAAPELLAPAGAALAETAAGTALEETAAGAAFGALGRSIAGAAGGIVRSVAGAAGAAAGFIGQAGRAFVDSSGAAARSLAGTLTDPARFGEASAQFTRSAFVDKAKDAVVIGAAGELARRAAGAVHDVVGRARGQFERTRGQLERNPGPIERGHGPIERGPGHAGRPHKHGHHRHISPDPAEQTAELVGGR